MSTRNEDFPLERDFAAGGQWISTLLLRIHPSVIDQVVILEQFENTCLTYYRRFINAEQGFFLNNHDLENICLLFDLIHPLSTSTFGRIHVFFIYSRIIADRGHLETTDESIQGLLEMMNNLNIFASTDLPTNHMYYQERATI